MQKGRPSKYNAEVADAICRRLSHGEPLNAICKDEEMPGLSTVMDWLNPRGKFFKPNFSELYARAREIQADTLADEILEIADNSANDWEPVLDKEGVIVDIKVNREAIDRARVRIDARKWRAARMAPKRWGDRVEQVHTGDASADPIKLLLEEIAQAPASKPQDHIKEKDVG